MFGAAVADSMLGPEFPFSTSMTSYRKQVVEQPYQGEDLG